MTELLKNAQAVANSWIERRGYFVIAAADICEPGQIVTDVSGIEGYQIVIIGGTTEKEFREMWPGEPILPGYVNFYRVTAE